MRGVCRILAWWLIGASLSVAGGPPAVGARVASAGEPLHARIDQLIAAKFDGTEPAPLIDEVGFLRRVWLDLAGRIPTADEMQRFLSDDAPNKRAEEVDRLFAAPTYGQRMADLFHVMLMERRGDDEHWRKFLQDSFERNRPWNEIVHTILKPDDADETARGAAFFYTKRLESYGQNPTDFPGLTRDVGRLFLGVDLQCAQCHNHLFIDDYKQRDFQGLFAVYQNLSIRRGVDFPAIDEKAMTAKLEFVSVFDADKQETGPRLPFGEEFLIPAPSADEKKDEKNADGPSFSALALIADELPTAENELFASNIVNRLWFLMMGRGLVDPFDQFHSDNPPSHPELLTLLASEFAAHNFDIQWMLRELALTETYQRSSQMPAAGDPPAAHTYLVANEKRLSAEQLFCSTLIATGNLQRLTAHEGDKPNADFDDLKKRFLDAFANEPREPEIDQDATVKAALFLLNDDKVLGLLKPQPGNLVERLMKTDDATALVDELFQSVFVRLPTEEERAAVTAYLEKNADRRDIALGQVVWSMLSSVEFCVNH
jgi:hypothetical protein